MAQPNLDPTAADAGDVLGTYLRAQATTFLRALRLHEEGGPPATGDREAGGGAWTVQGQLGTTARRHHRHGRGHPRRMHPGRA
ncbi:hypothetical protein ABZ873_31900, partial [Streptomyces sp. NPDC047014]